jgi:hypothetical protein
MYNATTGLAITTSAITLVPTTKSVTVSASSTATNMPAAGSNVKISIAMAELTSESITGVANCELIMVRTN